MIECENVRMGECIQVFRCWCVRCLVCSDVNVILNSGVDGYYKILNDDCPSEMNDQNHRLYKFD